MKYIILFIFTVIILLFPILKEYRILSFEKLDYGIYVPIVIIYLAIFGRALCLEYRSERKLRSLEKQELLLREFALKVEYQCKLNNGDSREETPSGVIHGRKFFAYLVENDKCFPEKTLKLSSKIPIDFSSLNKRDIVVRVDFYPANDLDILNKPINILEKYKEIRIPIWKVLELIGKNQLIKNVKIDLKAIINNKLIIHKKENFTSSNFKEVILIIKANNGIFKGIEKKYLS